jgi:hypothetical protein
MNDGTEAALLHQQARGEPRRSIEVTNAVPFPEPVEDARVGGKLDDRELLGQLGSVDEGKLAPDNSMNGTAFGEDIGILAANEQHHPQAALPRLGPDSNDLAHPWLRSRTPSEPLSNCVDRGAGARGQIAEEREKKTAHGSIIVPLARERRPLLEDPFVQASKPATLEAGPVLHA